MLEQIASVAFIGNIITCWDPFYEYELTLIPACISDHMPRKVRGEIAYPFPNFNWSLGMDKYFSNTV